MQPQTPADALRAYLVRARDASGPRSRSELAVWRHLVEAVVDELKARKMTAERVVLEIKRISEPDGHSSHSSPMWAQIVNWTLARYFAPPPEPAGRGNSDSEETRRDQSEPRPGA